MTILIGAFISFFIGVIITALLGVVWEYRKLVRNSNGIGKRCTKRDAECICETPQPKYTNISAKYVEQEHLDNYKCALEETDCGASAFNYQIRK
jgi:hypothetical protein